MKKRFIILLCVAVILLTATTQAAARADYCVPSLTFDGTTATCELKVIRESMSDQIEVILSLWHGNQMIGVWIEETAGYLSMSETVTVTRGNTYTLEVDLTINGEEVDVMPISKKCE